MRKIFLIAFLCLFTKNWGQVQIDGIYYYLDSYDKTAEVTSGSIKYKGAVIIPSSVTAKFGEYTVKTIRSSAFRNCTELTNVTIPNSITSIEAQAFEDCNNLSEINVSNQNQNYTSEDGILYTKDKSTLMQYPAGKQNTSFNIPSLVTIIGESAFYGCSKLTSVTIPNSVTHICEDAFYGCNGLTSVTIPNSVTYIGASALGRLKNLYILSPDIFIYSYTKIGHCDTVYAYKDVGLHDLSYKQRVEICNPYFFISDLKYPGHSTLTFQVKELPCYPGYGTLVKVVYNDTTLSPDEAGVYRITGLSNGMSGVVSLVINVNGTEETYQQELYMKVLEHEFRLSVNSDQTNLYVSIGADIPFKDEGVKEIGVSLGDHDYGVVPVIDGDFYKGEVTIPNLVPNEKYYLRPYIIYEDDIKVYGDKTSTYNTKGVSPKIKNSILSPTVYKAYGTYDLGTATFKKDILYFDGKEMDGNTIYMTGLEPDTRYTLKYVVITNEGSSETYESSITTPKLKLTTLQPKGVSDKCSIVAASTNINEDETSVGFQWKKYDAPESLKPSEGYAAIYNGQLEGYIKNLQPTSYYNVRAFYKSAAEKYYYSDWVTFDPSDFSYFEPTVHTYEATNVTSSSVMVKGYVLAGTDNILEQGFEYWPVSKSESNAKRINAAPSNDVSTIFSTGQVMTATIKDLKPNTTYSFRSFVKTNTGVTYGEEMMFTTDYDTTGIDSLTDNSSEVMVVDYHDINSRKLNKIGNGITIIRYSDGSVRKVIKR